MCKILRIIFPSIPKNKTTTEKPGPKNTAENQTPPWIQKTLEANSKKDLEKIYKEIDPELRERYGKYLKNKD